MATKIQIIEQLSGVGVEGVSEETLSPLTKAQLEILGRVKDDATLLTEVLTGMTAKAANTELTSELETALEENSALTSQKNALQKSSNTYTVDVDKTTYIVTGSPMISGNKYTFKDVSENVEINHPVTQKVIGLADYLVGIKSGLVEPLKAE